MKIEELVANATADKMLAQAARKDGDYDRAIVLIERAIKTLETEKPRLASVEKDVVSSENRALAETLADVYGSSGGIYRSAKQYSKSVKAYDCGAMIEQDERFGFVNSYNLTQRLVARVLEQPKEWIHAERVIEGERFDDLLKSAKATVTNQTLGPRAGDVWAWADLGMLRLLNGDKDDAEEAWEKVVDLATKPFVIDSTNSVVSDLLERLVPVAAENGADPRLGEVADSLRDARQILAS
jgi:tetratricopeptide (TPR) repeat protein